jgi:hypothetical protein
MLTESCPQDNSSKDHVTPTFTDIPVHPGFAPTMLGKRHRDSTASNVTGVIEEGEEDDYSETELAKRVVRPTKKRPKIDGHEVQPEVAEAGSGSQNQGARVPNFTVYSGDSPQQSQQLQDPPPPTTRLPDYFAPPSPSGNRPTTSTANAAENQNPFNFSFLPMSSGGSMYMNSMPNFPFPDAPQSPSPAGNTNELFPGFGVPSRPRSGTANKTTASNSNPEFVDPAMLSRDVSDREREEKREREGHQLTSNEVAAGLGLTVVRTGASDPDETPRENEHVKRTMYGTELEGDTRFGDFGVEGVASGFWAGGRF